MDLWIRSQNRQELVKAEKLYIVHSDSGLCDYIRDGSSSGYLAKYTKEGRALEILDEIQELLKDNVVMCDDNGYATLLENIKIYEMPKE